MLRTTNLVPMAHLICVAHTRLELAEILVDLRRAGIENLMALGGDPPTDPDAAVGELAHASELVELARAIGGFSIGVAAHPTGHPLSPDLAGDRDHLAAKLALADFAVTQFFFEASDYTSLVADLAERGVDQAGPAGDHAGGAAQLGAGHGPHGGGGAGVDGRAPGGGRRPGRGRGGPPRGRGLRHRAVPAAAGRRGAGPALLHTQPVERDPRDLLGAGTGRRLTGRPGPAGRSPDDHGGRPYTPVVPSARTDPGNGDSRAVARLRDGTRVLLRPAGHDDGPAILDGFARCSADTRYFRFLSGGYRLTDERLAALTDADHRDHAVWLALDLDAPGTPVAALARFVRSTTDREVAEVAFIVADDYQGRGSAGCSSTPCGCPPPSTA